MTTFLQQSPDNAVRENGGSKPFFSKALIQPKLTINTPGDAHEQEADAMADKVMRMPMPQGNAFFKPALSALNRKCASCEQEDKQLHRKHHGPDDLDEKKLHRKENSDAEAHGGHDLDSYVTSLSGSGQPLLESSRHFFEPRFGHDFSNVKVHTDSVAAKSAQSINALAYTTGNNIVFNSGQYAPGTESGQRLMAHELTHVVQQGGGGVQTKLIQRFKIQGPWNIGDPVHENLTLYALIEAGLIPEGTRFDSSEVWEFMRGVIWNDDPEGLLFDNNENENHNWSSGLMWYSHFHHGESQANHNHQIGKNDTLTARSHYGDLQFIHGMATKDGEKAIQTKEQIMMWLEFTYKVAINEIPENTILNNIPIQGIRTLFSGTAQENQSIKTFFHVNRTGNTQQRAVGSLLHTIQDSYAEGHTQRDNGQNGEVESFHSYTNQDENKHADKDKLPQALKDETMRNRLSRIPGADTAIFNCAVILIFYKQKNDWNIVKGFLDTNVFKLKYPDNLSSSGVGFEKRKR